MSTIEPIRNHILFQFEDDHIQAGAQGKSHFREKTKWGFEIGFTSAYDSTAKHPRWGRVLFIGKDVINDIKPGMLILIDSLKWTAGVNFNGGKVWRTDDKQVLAVNK